MPSISLKPQARFLLLGSALLAALLILWWLVLMNPLLFLLHQAVDVCGGVVSSGAAAFSVTETPSGDWTFEVPLEAVLPPSPANPAPQQIHSISFDMARSVAGAFTFGLPVYWALMLAAPGIRRNIRPLLLGTLAVAILEIVLALLTAEILAQVTLARMVRAHDPIGHWFLRFGYYLAVDTIPYLMPFAVAICSHRELREQVFNWASGEPVAAGNDAASGGNDREPRHRAKKPGRRRS
jgi:hypothetical protein